MSKPDFWESLDLDNPVHFAVLLARVGSGSSILGSPYRRDVETPREISEYEESTECVYRYRDRWACDQPAAINVLLSYLCLKKIRSGDVMAIELIEDYLDTCVEQFGSNFLKLFPKVRVELASLRRAGGTSRRMRDWLRRRARFNPENPALSGAAFGADLPDLSGAEVGAGPKEEDTSEVVKEEHHCEKESCPEEKVEHP